MPTQERLRELFDYKPDTGLLISRIQRGKLRPGTLAGAVVGTGHVLCGLGNRKYQFAHRIIWTMLYGPIPSNYEIDHINGDAADNRLLNLRIASHGENLKNQKRRRDNSSGTTGIYFRLPEKRWVAYIRANNQKYWLGSFLTKPEAVAARKTAEARLGFHSNHGRVIQ